MDNTADTIKASNTNNNGVVDTSASSEQEKNIISSTKAEDNSVLETEQTFNQIENALFVILKSIKKKNPESFRIRRVKGTEHKYTIEFFKETSLEELIKQKTLENIKKKKVMYSSFDFNKMLFTLTLTGIDYPIEMKFKKLNGGYSRIICDICRAIGERKKISREVIEKDLREKYAKELGKDNRVKNIPDCLTKFFKPLGEPLIRDLLFEYRGGKLKYKKNVYIKDLKQMGIKSLIIKDREYAFDFDKGMWVEQDDFTQLSPKEKGKRRFHRLA